MDGAKTVVQRRSRPLFLWVGLLLLLTYVNFIVVGIVLRGRRAVGYVEIGLLAAFYLVLIFKPSDAKEVDRLIDVEAATATLGITFWTGIMWGSVADALHISTRPRPDLVAAFIFVVYLLSKALVALRYRA